jgi:hypothetical protein
MEDNGNRQRKLPKPNNVISVPHGINSGFFKWWCIFLKPFVPLTPKEIDVIASFLKQRYELSKIISDAAILDEQLMSESTKMKVLEECGITKQHFYVIMSNLRKNNVITPSGINPRLIPNIREDDNGVFQLLILFRDNV